MRKHRRILGLLFVALALLVSGCGSGESSESGSGQPSGSEGTPQGKSSVSVKMGTQPWIGYGPWWIAEKKGIFEKYGLDVEMISFVQDSDINAAFAANQIQVANLATHTTMKMIANNDLDLSVIIFMDESTKADAVIAPEGMNSIQDLKGKKVGFEEGTTSDLLLRQALSDNGMSMEDLEAVFMPAADAGLALLAKQIDAAVTYEPYISEVMKKGEKEGIHILYSGSDSPGLISDVTVVKNDFLKEHPEMKETLQKIWDEALAYWKENPEEGNQIVAEGSGISAEELPPILEGLNFFDMKQQKELLDSGQLLDTTQNIQEVLLNQKSLEKEVDLEKMFNSTFAA